MSIELPVAATLTNAPDLQWLGAIVSAHPYGAAMITALALVSAVWARSLLGSLVEYTTTPWDNRALRWLLWIADALTSKKNRPGTKVRSRRAKRMDGLIRSNAALKKTAIEEGIIDAQPMNWLDD